MRIKKTTNLEELREKARQVKEKGEVMMSTFMSHFKKMEEYYTAWEAELNEIQNEINKAQEEYGIEAEKITQYDLMQDLNNLQ